ncbi:MAG: DUF3501 family protein [Gammaproteobacteria bacterium]
MQPLTREDLYSLEDYAEIRPDFRARVMEHKRNRKLPIGPNATLYFEDRLTIHYQVQEMLRIERIFEKQAIEEELQAYNPLIPDGSNLKATFMIEFDDPVERRKQLHLMRGIEDHVWLQVEGHEPIVPFVDEDLERSNQEATSAVHFVRFELSPAIIGSLRRGASIRAGITHPAYSYELTVPDPICKALVRDLD